MYNANPLHDVIPLDWAGIAWALRTVWLRSLNRPDMLPALAGLSDEKKLSDKDTARHGILPPLGSKQELG
jgi:hypothetical protein